MSFFTDFGTKLTGASGYIGFKTLKIALERGYNIRAVVRQDRNASDLEGKSELIAKARQTGRLEWAVIPDFLAKGAISQALEGIIVVVHMASPLAIEVCCFRHKHNTLSNGCD